MTLEELQVHADKDLKINDTELDLESLKNTSITQSIFKTLNKV